MQACCHGDHVGEHGERAQVVRIFWMLLGSAFVLNAYLGDLWYADNPLVLDVSAAVGALILAAPIFWSALKDLVRGEMHMDELVALAVLAAMSQGDFRTAGVVAFFMLLSLVIEAAPPRARTGHREPDPPHPHHGAPIDPPARRRKWRPPSWSRATASGCARAKTYPPTAPWWPAAPR
jgi:hypothetical protein